MYTQENPSFIAKMWLNIEQLDLVLANVPSLTPLLLLITTSCSMAPLCCWLLSDWQKRHYVPPCPSFHTSSCAFLMHYMPWFSDPKQCHWAHWAHFSSLESCLCPELDRILDVTMERNSYLPWQSVLHLNVLLLSAQLSNLGQQSNSQRQMKRSEMNFHLHLEGNDWCCPGPVLP